MTKLLEEAILRLRELPEDCQNRAANQLMRYAEELSDRDEIAAADL